MKIKKRILSFALAVMLIAALAVPAFAASTTNSGTYDDCIYSTYTSDYPEMMGSGSIFESSVTYQGQVGYQYRAFIYFHAKNSSGTRTAMAYAY